MEIYTVYVLYLQKHNRFYIGQTNDVISRLHRHNSGYESVTSPYIGWEVICSIMKDSRGEVMILEKELNTNLHQLNL